MKDTISKLKGKVYGQIYEEYIVDYILRFVFLFCNIEFIFNLSGEYNISF